jgi:hypothetical protein
MLNLHNMHKYFVLYVSAAFVGGCIVIDEAGHIADMNCRRVYSVAPPSPEYTRCYTYERRRINAQLSEHDDAVLQDFRRAVDRTSPNVMAVPHGSTIITPDGRVLHVPW